VTTVNVLLRSLVRIGGVDAALVAIDGTQVALAACGLNARDAAQTLTAARAGSIVASGLRIEHTLPITLHDGRRATLFILNGTPLMFDPVVTHALPLLAAEIGLELDGRGAFRGAFGGLLEQIAAGIESLNDAAAIIEWPRVGSQARILYVNAAFESLLGYDAPQAIGQTLQFLYGPLTDLERVEFMNDRVRETLEARIPIAYYRRDGVPIWVEVSLRGLAGTPENAPCMVATLRDVSTRKEFEYALAREKRKLQVTLAAIGDGVITAVADGRIDSINLAAQDMLDVEAAEAYGEPIAAVLRLTDAAGHFIDVLPPLGGENGVARGQAQLGRDSSVKHVAYVSSPIGAEGYVVVLRDVTAQHRLSSQLSYEASHDPLTSMFNRRRFDKVLEDAIESTHRGDGPHALAFLDLDRFKQINDNCGHAVGDRVLLDLANVLQAQLRGRDVLARIGGDEFAVLLHDCTLDNARRVLEKLRRAVDAYRVFYAGREYQVGVSIGIAAIDGSESDGGVIFAQADAACYAAKSGGRNAIAG
jgi:diguanylate cyclase (GGDEF)-like protein/PAS domain S-box-containing protein